MFLFQKLISKIFHLKNCKFFNCLFIGTNFKDVAFHRCVFNECNFSKASYKNFKGNPKQWDSTMPSEGYQNIGTELYHELRKNYHETKQRAWKNYAEYKFSNW